MLNLISIGKITPESLKSHKICFLPKQSQLEANVRKAFCYFMSIRKILPKNQMHFFFLFPTRFGCLHNIWKKGGASNQSVHQLHGTVGTVKCVPNLNQERIFDMSSMHNVFI